MSFFQLKTLLAAFFSAAAAVAFLTMMAALGRSEHTVRPVRLRAAHRAAGYTFVVLMLVAAVMGARYVRFVGDGLPTRGVLHMVLALLLVAVVAIKVAVVRFFRQFLRYAPAIGMTAFVLAFAVASVSAGFFLVTGGGGGGAVGGAGASAPEERETRRAGPLAGAALFAGHCGICHDAESTERRVGPGLGGLFRRGALVSSGRAVTRASVADQIRDPVGTMPSFGARLSSEEIGDLVGYLEGL